MPIKDTLVKLQSALSLGAHGNKLLQPLKYSVQIIIAYWGNIYRPRVIQAGFSYVMQGRNVP